MAATYEPIATTTLGSATTTITFSSLPNTYTDLRVVFVGIVASGQNAYGRLNGDTGTNYSHTDMAVTGGTVYGEKAINLSWIKFFNWAGPNGTLPAAVVWDIFDYNSSSYKGNLITLSNDQNGGTGTGSVERRVSTWRSTAAVTSLTILSGGNLPIGTVATVYGIKAA